MFQRSGKQCLTENDTPGGHKWVPGLVSHKICFEKFRKQSPVFVPDGVGSRSPPLARSRARTCARRYRLRRSNIVGNIRNSNSDPQLGLRNSGLQLGPETRTRKSNLTRNLDPQLGHATRIHNFVRGAQALTLDPKLAPATRPGLATRTRNSDTQLGSATRIAELELGARTRNSHPQLDSDPQLVRNSVLKPSEGSTCFGTLHRTCSFGTVFRICVSELRFVSPCF